MKLTAGILESIIKYLVETQKYGCCGNLLYDEHVRNLAKGLYKEIVKECD